MWLFLFSFCLFSFLQAKTEWSVWSYFLQTTGRLPYSRCVCVFRRCREITDAVFILLIKLLFGAVDRS